jgi:hypothetical protein
MILTTGLASTKMQAQATTMHAQATTGLHPMPDISQDPPTAIVGPVTTNTVELLDNQVIYRQNRLPELEAVSHLQRE